MQGSFTGPRVFWSGSSLRTEATGYGLVFFVQLMLAGMNKEIKGLRCAVSGSGKITMLVLEKLIGYGSLPITVSDSKGYLVDEDGFDYMKISFLRDIKAQKRSLRDYSKTCARSKYYDEAKPWSVRGDVAFPCGYQNEIDQSDAINLVNSGCRILVVAGELELNHECNLLNWSPEDFESKLQIYQRALKAASDFGYQKESPEEAPYHVYMSSVFSAFLTIAQAMSDQGCV
ncbi:hypothetical protein POPTR_001G193600v4 [Populus trichocarpa]|uniref:Uncharacterized protein n=1 Tax=Populus trichocarpa TaxID=3694 RepID=A0ACC0TJW3_POPTR|nr:hypothetical protein POPTR_001G193600v4 [Populus trichocarpa]